MRTLGTVIHPTLEASLRLGPRLLVALLLLPVLIFAAQRWLKPVPAGERGEVPAPEQAAGGVAPAAAVSQRQAASTRAGAPAVATESSQHSAPVAADALRPASLVIRSVVVRGLDGRIAWRGDVDLAPVLARIEAGQHDAHRNDGGIFGNREGSLPARSRGYYHEYVVRTPGLAGPGPQRLVLGAGAEVYYSPDHYATFRRVR